MERTLTIEIPETVYSSLLLMARKTGRTVQELVVEWLTNEVRVALEDPVERFIGAFRSNVSDWVERHDEYLGRAALE
ncbi:MAG: hypothetical protein ACPLYD_03940 [Anaerolineae bacterium]|jgi:hypothetical protein